MGAGGGEGFRETDLPARQQCEWGAGALLAPAASDGAYGLPGSRAEQSAGHRQGHTQRS